MLARVRSSLWCPEPWQTIFFAQLAHHHSIQQGLSFASWLVKRVQVVMCCRDARLSRSGGSRVASKGSLTGLTMRLTIGPELMNSASSIPLNPLSLSAGRW